MCTLRTSSGTARSLQYRDNLDDGLWWTQITFLREMRLSCSHWLSSKPRPAQLPHSISASPATKTMRNSTFVIAAALSLATTGFAVAERAHVKQQQLLAVGGRDQSQACPDKRVDGKAGFALAPLEQLSIGPDERSCGSVRRTVMPPSHIDYDLPPESIAGLSAP
jgi:hypothetical protein